ncbi:MAG: secondary thiamine-phosphate synthase enzyme YjbQ [Candidatus Nitrosocosmicus sp.]
MFIKNKTIQIRSTKESEIIDITEIVCQAVKESKMANGIITVFVKGSTAALTTIENEPGLLNDFPEMLSRIAPKNVRYVHDEAWHDGNGHSHVKASLVGPSLTIPFIDGNLTLGTWQQIVFIEMDIRPRERTLVIQIIGDNK